MPAVEFLVGTVDEVRAYYTALRTAINHAEQEGNKDVLGTLSAMGRKTQFCANQSIDRLNGR